MSHQPLGLRHRASRRVASLLAPALVGGLILTSGPAVSAASIAPAPTRPAEAVRQRFTAGSYLVQLADKPVTTYSRTAVKPGQRLNTRTEAVRDYVDHLNAARKKVLDAVNGVRPVYNYHVLLNGFAAKLTASQANDLARTPGVVSMTRNVMSHPMAETGASAATGTSAAATRGVPKAVTGEAKATSAADTLAPPDTAAFLGLKKPGGLYSKIPGGRHNAGAGTIIGVLDGGIDARNPSLQALPDSTPGADIIARKWKGSCDPGDDPAHRVTCNNKVIGAQYFNKDAIDPKDIDWPSPMDSDGHGTHTATTAAGNADVPASVPDTAISGRISGIAPAARIAAYKVCWTWGCGGTDVVAALEKAVSDGVDVINYSLSLPYDAATTSLQYEVMANAAKAGVFISASAGNDGPGTVSNGVPWVTTVAASSHDTGYRTTLTLGNGSSYTGVGVSGTALPSAPLVDAAKAAKSGVDADQAALCKANTLDPAEVKGAIVICKRGDNWRTDKSAQVKAAGGIGLVLYNPNATDDEAADAHTVPAINLDKASGEAVKAYADNAGSGATASLGAARAVHQEAPKASGFSSGGPDYNSRGDLLKPDITAPGVDIVAGVTPGGVGGPYKGEQGLMSGTSMSAPHVAGLALLLRQLHPDWSPMEIKSALMTTATTKDNEGKPIQRQDGSAATPLDYGAGHVVPNSADDPGLVYESTPADWAAYPCAIGQLPVTTDGSDPCADVRKFDPSDFNSPTISVGDIAGKQTVARTVTDVTGTDRAYRATLRTPPGYRAQVSPEKLVVPAGGSATYKITFTRTDAAYGDWKFGSLDWSDGYHKVRSTVALRAARINAPGEVKGEAADGSFTLTPKPGFDGTFITSVNGLYADTVKTGTLTGTDPNFDPSRLTAATVKTEITVPEGTAFARVAILSSDYLKGSDMDMYVYDKKGNLVFYPLTGNEEHVDLKPGTYEVYLSQFVLPQGVSSQEYTLRTWLIGKDGKPDQPVTADPAKQQVSQGDIAASTISWRDLAADHAYLGLVDYGDGTDTVGSSVLTIVP
ncbi:S8 family serine peptidase [Streptomyces sp. NPDC088921]|uniref:S8 family serine peptidase n=1 Tax=unclassified Streptomyces TaxID=2593676 RepID=UPI00341EA766